MWVTITVHPFSALLEIDFTEQVRSSGMGIPTWLLQLAIVIVAAVVVVVLVTGALSLFFGSVRTFIAQRAVRPIVRVFIEESTANTHRHEDRHRRQDELREGMADLIGGLLGFAPGDGVFHRDQIYRYERAAARLKLECPQAAGAIDDVLSYTNERSWYDAVHRPELRSRIDAVSKVVSVELRAYEAPSGDRKVK